LRKLRRKGIPYDPIYKGIIEIPVDDEGLMKGFKVHWPNASASIYRRTTEGIEMTNCSLDMKNANIQMFIGLYARRPGTFSPLVEIDALPIYTPLEGNNAELMWPSPDAGK
jgi:hypothetical protein